MRADGSVLRLEPEHLEGLVVGQNETAVGVQHAKAVRHVIKRHVEAAGKGCGALLRRDHLHEIGSQPF
jgi:hypothetical protein